MNEFLALYDKFLQFLRPALFALGLLAAAVFALDWAVRTRRINPFSPLARFVRRAADPIVAPMERRIVRAGGLPSSAPWWTLAAVVLGSIVLVWALEFFRIQIASILTSSAQGPAGILALLVHWTFAILQAALLVRVLSSWISISPYSKWIRWSFVLTEPILRPLRQIVPLIGMIDITPLIAFFLLSITQRLLLNLLINGL